MTSWIRSKSCQFRIQVTAAMPGAGEAEADHEAGGKHEQRPPRLDEPQRGDHDEERRRVEEASARRAHMVSPTATSFGLTGVESIAS